jgi:hypothetical protein
MCTNRLHLPVRSGLIDRKSRRARTGIQSLAILVVCRVLVVRTSKLLWGSSASMVGAIAILGTLAACRENCRYSQSGLGAKKRKKSCRFGDSVTRRTPPEWLPLGLSYLIVFPHHQEFLSRHSGARETQRPALPAKARRLAYGPL